jgi:hypothetical protein
MKSVTCSNGVVLQYDDSIVVGDMITAYNKGLHIVTEIIPREGQTPLFAYRRVFDSEHRAVKTKKIDSCDASYCRKAMDHLMQALEARKQEIASIETIISNLTRS